MLPLFDNPLATGVAWFGSWLPALRPTATQVAELAFARRHICRLDPLPPAVVDMMAAANPELYKVMWGPVECQPTGLLRDFDVTDRLNEIQVPALVISGVADEVTPVQSKLLADGLPDARWVLFQHSSHSAMLEEPEHHWSRGARLPRPGRCPPHHHCNAARAGLIRTLPVDRPSRPGGGIPHRAWARCRTRCMSVVTTDNPDVVTGRVP